MEDREKVFERLSLFQDVRDKLIWDAWRADISITQIGIMIDRTSEQVYESLRTRAAIEFDPKNAPPPRLSPLTQKEVFALQSITSGGVAGQLLQAMPPGIHMSLRSLHKLMEQLKLEAWSGSLFDSMQELVGTGLVVPKRDEGYMRVRN